MFSHRLTQFVWHIWRKYRYHISFRNGGVDAFSQRMYSLVGLGHRQLRDKLAINHSKMLAYSGIWQIRDDPRKLSVAWCPTALICQK